MLSAHSSSAAEVEVWKIQVSTCQMAEYLALLSSNESNRMVRFRLREDQDRYAVAHGSLRLILGQKLGMSPDELEFAQSELGKPYLLTKDLKFNLSHSGDWVWIAVAESTEVGIDVEKIKSIDGDALIQRFGSEEELEFFRGLTQQKQLEAFFTWWTRKEALLKAVGKGLSGGLSSFTAWRGTVEPVQVSVCSESDVEWFVHTLESATGYCGALAVSSSVSQIVQRTMPT